MKGIRNVWAVIHVWRGLPGGVELFATEEAALQRQIDLCAELPNEDEVGVFCTDLPDGILMK